MSETTPLLEVEGLRKVFVGSRGFGGSAADITAVDGVDLSVDRGKTLGVVGETGSGKTTLAWLMLGLHRPTEGRVHFEGFDLWLLPRERLRELRRDMQVVFQDPYSSLDPRMRIGSIVAEPLVTHNHPGARSRAALTTEVGRLLESVGLDGADQKRYPHEFSGGQRQRVGIARALALNPKLLVLDEPVSALDVSIQAQIINLLQRLQDERAMAYVFVTHDLSVVRHVADRIAVMYMGRVVEVGDTEDLFTQPRHPYTVSLLSAAPIPDPVRERERHRIVLKGEPPSPAERLQGCTFRSRCPIAQPECASLRPGLAPAGSEGHQVACHFPLRMSEDISRTNDIASPSVGTVGN